MKNRLLNYTSTMKNLLEIVFWSLWAIIFALSTIAMACEALDGDGLVDTLVKLACTLAALSVCLLFVYATYAAYKGHGLF